MESDAQGGPSFQDGVSSSLMATEELRQELVKPITSPQCLKVRHRLEEVVSVLFSLEPRDDVENDLRKHCHSKACSTAFESLKYATTKKDNPDVDIPDVERDVQGAIARIAELSLVLHHEESKDNLPEIVSTYVSYQRQVIRQRAKPSIARLVSKRQALQDSESLAHRGEEENDDEASKSSHAHVITNILGQASALIHPLLMWRSQLPEELEMLRKLCADSIATLNEQAQTLTKTVATWYIEDRHIDELWMSQSAKEAACTSSQLGELDAVVDEIAFCCQVFDRYVSLLSSERNASELTSSIEDLAAEWTWKYASLERYLTTQQLRSAMQLAHPVQIVLGTPIQVPSVVEDSQYLSTRALKRAASTRSSQAIGTVAHSVASDVWSTSHLDGGVHQALVEQQGCWKEETTEPAPAAEAKPSSSSFANALLGALEDDMRPSHASPPRSGTRPPSAPSSGNFLNLGSLPSLGAGDRLQKIRLDTFLCALNGIHSAAAACSSLVKFLDSLLPKDDTRNETKESNMTKLAREELFSFSSDYQKLLESQIALVVSQFCGSLSDAPVYRGSYCIPILRYYLERENYNLPNAEHLRESEDDARLAKQLVDPLQRSPLLQQYQKCDPDVLQGLCGELVIRLVDLFLDCILSEVVPKRFTDWGALLLSKQVRMVQSGIAAVMEKASNDSCHILPQWERLSLAVTILQLEKPSDWSFYKDSTIFAPEEVKQIMKLRVDFSVEAILVATTPAAP